MPAPMRLPEPRGPLSDALARDLAGRGDVAASTLQLVERTAPAEALTDDDLQLSLAICY